MNRRNITIASLILCSVFLVSGCGKNTVSTPGGGSVSQTDDKITVTNDSGETTVFTTDRLPEGFPSDVPVYPDATIQGSQLSDYGTNLSLQSKKTTAEVLAWYKNELVDTSWKIASEYSMDNSTWISGSKDDGSTIIVTVGQSTEANSGYATVVGIIRSNPQSAAE